MVGDWKNINIKKEKREKNKKVVVLEKSTFTKPTLHDRIHV